MATSSSTGTLGSPIQLPINRSPSLDADIVPSATFPPHSAYNRSIAILQTNKVILPSGTVKYNEGELHEKTCKTYKIIYPELLGLYNYLTLFNKNLELVNKGIIDLNRFPTGMDESSENSKNGETYVQFADIAGKIREYANDFLKIEAILKEIETLEKMSAIHELVISVNNLYIQYDAALKEAFRRVGKFNKIVDYNGPLSKLDPRYWMIPYRLPKSSSFSNSSTSSTSNSSSSNDSTSSTSSSSSSSSDSTSLTSSSSNLNSSWISLWFGVGGTSSTTPLSSRATNESVAITPPSSSHTIDKSTETTQSSSPHATTTLLLPCATNESVVITPPSSSHTIDKSTVTTEHSSPHATDKSTVTTEHSSPHATDKSTVTTEHSSPHATDKSTVTTEHSSPHATDKSTVITEPPQIITRQVLESSQRSSLPPRTWAEILASKDESTVTTASPQIITTKVLKSSQRSSQPLRTWVEILTSKSDNNS